MLILSSDGSEHSGAIGVRFSLRQGTASVFWAIKFTYCAPWDVLYIFFMNVESVKYRVLAKFDPLLPSSKLSGGLLQSSNCSIFFDTIVSVVISISHLLGRLLDSNCNLRSPTVSG